MHSMTFFLHIVNEKVKKNIIVFFGYRTKCIDGGQSNVNTYGTWRET